MPLIRQAYGVHGKKEARWSSSVVRSCVDPNREEILASWRGVSTRGRGMIAFDPKLEVVVSGKEIVVVLPGSSYTVTYFKRRGSAGLLAKNIADKDDPRHPNDCC
jgi:hypothetical protein